uniref:Uncharacterized protein n=1 Tax=Brassica oleracea var. oleracea TaxID=109376 RepID=A0A0D3ED18_BRAOL
MEVDLSLSPACLSLSPPLSRRISLSPDLSLRLSLAAALSLSQVSLAVSLSLSL